MCLKRGQMCLQHRLNIHQRKAFSKAIRNLSSESGFRFIRIQKSGLSGFLLCVWKGVKCACNIGLLYINGKLFPRLFGICHQNPDPWPSRSVITVKPGLFCYYVLYRNTTMLLWPCCFPVVKIIFALEKHYFHNSCTTGLLCGCCENNVGHVLFFIQICKVFLMSNFTWHKHDVLVSSQQKALICFDWSVSPKQSTAWQCVTQKMHAPPIWL